MYSQYLIFGSIAKDEIIFLPGKFEDFLDPNKPSKLNFSFLAEHIAVQLGGIATNISYSLAQITDKPVFILGGIGAMDSTPFENLFDKVGVRQDYLLTEAGQITGTYKALSDKNNNQIGGFYYGANQAAKQILLDKIEGIKDSLLVISANHPEAFYEIQQQAINLELDFMYDVGMALSWIEAEKLKEGCLQAKWIIVNDVEIVQLEKITQLKIADFIKHGAAIIITKGKDGATLINSEQEINISVVPNIKVVDPTAAGDSFRAGFLVGLEKGFGLEKALKCGAAVASVCLECEGGVKHTLDWVEVEKRMALIV